MTPTCIGPADRETPCPRCGAPPLEPCRLHDSEVNRDATEPYRVEIDNDGCGHCAAGRTWTVIDAEDTALCTSWEDKDTADDVAHWMNQAYRVGIVKGSTMMHEDELPESMENEYDAWFAESCVVDGVRMGPRWPKVGA